MMTMRPFPEMTRPVLSHRSFLYAASAACLAGAAFAASGHLILSLLAIGLSALALLLGRGGSCVTKVEYVPERVARPHHPVPDEEAGEFLEAILESVAEGVALFVAEGGLMAWNRPLADLMAMTASHPIMGLKVDELLSLMGAPTTPLNGRAGAHWKNGLRAIAFDCPLAGGLTCRVCRSPMGDAGFAVTFTDRTAATLLRAVPRGRTLRHSLAGEASLAGDGLMGPLTRH
jgi:hypothetical protein